VDWGGGAWRGRWVWDGLCALICTLDLIARPEAASSWLK